LAPALTAGAFFNDGTPLPAALDWRSSKPICGVVGKE
jgi:hypothetical protein